ncbi:MAG: hypothetical protein AB8B96_21300 [Lysobacterales bacterium]
MTRTTDLPDRTYLSTKELDAIARTQTEMLSELWILRDRVLVLEHLLEQANILPPAAIDDFEPPAELMEKLKADRDAVVSRVAGAGHRDRLDLEQIKKPR